MFFYFKHCCIPFSSFLLLSQTSWLRCSPDTDKCSQHCRLSKAFSCFKSFPLPEATDCFQHRVNLWGNRKLFCNLTEQTETRLYFMKKRLYASVQFRICCGTFCELRNYLLSGGLKILFASFTLGCLFLSEEHCQTSSSLKESRAFTSIYPRGDICYNS